MRVLGYVRVSTDEQSSSGAGLEAQRRAILAECERRGWQLVEMIEDAGYSAKDLKRPGVQEALRVLEAGEASAPHRGHSAGRHCAGTTGTRHTPRVNAASQMVDQYKRTRGSSTA